MPPGRDRACRRAHRAQEVLAGQLQIEERDEVERTRLELVFEDVRDDPFDVDAAARRELRRLREGDVGEVDARHPPAALREPDGVPPLAAGEVERAAGREAADLGGEEPVRVGAPDELLLRVARIPVLPGEAGPDGRLGATVLGHAANARCSERKMMAATV